MDTLYLVFKDRFMISACCVRLLLSRSKQRGIIPNLLPLVNRRSPFFKTSFQRRRECTPLNSLLDRRGHISHLNDLLSGLSKAVLRARGDYTDPKGIVKLRSVLSNSRRIRL